jgi:2-succinyl-5-enolpyruvyl-6-hydroxy-3-cyclohexene-1-carboxylate synthase
MIHANAPGEPGAANLRFARLLVDELQASGVVAAVVCPGSRSTPLALAVAGQRGLRYSVHLDERSAAFHALGYAKATGRPVALVCTSGTAGANFLPAIAEASHARVPLVVLSADRPPELRAWGAAQTMEQRSLYAGFARWSEEAPCPSEGVGDGYARALARRAVAEAMGAAPGPVHLNLPFREPLVPATIDVESLAGAVASAESTPPVLEPRDPDGTIVRALRSAKRGVLVFGPDAWDPSLADAATSLAAALGWPVVADPASGLRAGNIVPDSLVCHADLLLRHVATAAALQPEVILRFGGVPTAKAVNEWMACHAQAEVWLVDPAAGFRDPQHRAVRQLRLMPSQLAALVRAADVEPSTESLAWRSRWRNADRVAGSALTAALDGDARFLAPQLARALWSGLPARSALYAANSMAIRDLDAFAGPRAEPLRLLANRGVNGIDGLVSSALGAAQALRSPTVLWCGDLALLHDVSGLLAGQLHAADLTIVVSNDDGGGIFEYLPVARAVPREVFEPLFAVPHGLDLCALARGLGWQATRVASAEAFAAALSHAMAGGLHVIEVPVDRAANTALHARLNEAVRTALQGGPAA